MEKYSGIYSELAEIIGDENTEKVYESFRGQQITFPIRLYSVNYVMDYIKKNYNGSNLAALSRQFGYTERRIRQFLKEELSGSELECTENDYIKNKQLL